jgi:phosphoribosyl-ATP pyrophosphohydrolase
MSADGQVVDLLQTNEKGFKKSTERGELWVTDPETGRLLPDPAGRPLAGVHRGESWYLARLQPQAGASPAESATAPAGADSPAQQEPSPRPEAAAPAGAPDFSVLAELWTVIRKRNAERPAGSYTTHLFNEGEEKIRKKTGEEAVELLLARSREELTHESADLVYHLLVLLEATGIGVEALLAELGSR